MTGNRFGAIVATALALAGCATSTEDAWFRLDAPQIGGAAEADASAAPELSEAPEREAAIPEAGEFGTRYVPSLTTRGATGGPDTETPVFDTGTVNATLAPQPLPRFINAVFGEILEQPFIMGPEIAERTDVVSLRTVRDMDPDTFFSLVRQALEDYGVGVSYEDGVFRVVTLETLRAQMPQFIRSRAGAHVPSDLRPVVQFVELVAIDAADMEVILRQAFPDGQALQIRSDRRTNAIVLSGLSEDVDAALSIVADMDQLRFADTQVIRYSPRNWQAAELARALNDILTVEGFMVGVGTAAPKPVTILVLDFSNQILVFANTREVGQYVAGLARQLDAEAYQAEAEIPFVYQVRNAEATALAEVLSSVLGGGGASPQGPGGEGGAQTGGDSERRSGSVGGVTVDDLGNRIIFVGTQEEYARIERLLLQLDTRQPEVLIEVIIAEVNLTDGLNYGLDAVFDSETAARFSARLESDGGLTGVVQTGELSLSGSLASNNNQINVLSTPRVVTRSGSEATIQVGTEVPIITSQRATDFQSGGGNSDVLQQVQYRSTGVLVAVEPRVLSDDRIDLVISQELSAAEPNDLADIASPVISNRSITSELSLRDGQTAVLGGLIENRFTRSNDGIPFLKDVPVLGAPFRSESLSLTRNMLVVLVTPYVIRTNEDRQRMVDVLSENMNDAYSRHLNRSTTLRPPSEPMTVRPNPNLSN